MQDELTNEISPQMKKPNSNSITRKHRNLLKLNHVSKNWILELEFLRDEQLFLKNLLDTFFMDIYNTEYFFNTRKIIQKLDSYTKKANLLLLEMRTQGKLFATLLESNHLQGEQSYKNTHMSLANRYEQFTQSNKMLKSHVFELVDRIVKKHKNTELSDTNLKKENNSTG